MPQRAHVERPTATGVNAYGHATLSDQFAKHGLPCRLWQHSETEMQSDGRLFTVGQWRMRVPKETDLRQGDKVTVDGRELVVETVITRRTYQLATLKGVGG